MERNIPDVECEIEMRNGLAIDPRFTPTCWFLSAISDFETVEF